MKKPQFQYDVIGWEITIRHLFQNHGRLQQEEGMIYSFLGWKTATRISWAKMFLEKQKGMTKVRLMEEILHQLRYIKPYKYCDICHINWWTPDIWTINSYDFLRIGMT